MNFLEYPYRKQYAVVRNRICGNLTGTIELIDTTCSSEHTWYALGVNHQAIESGTKVYIVSQDKTILLVEPLQP